MSRPVACTTHANGYCQQYNRGHNVHFIHAKRVGSTPWGWRDAIVRSVGYRWITVDYLLEPVSLRLWHHASLRGELHAGDPVRVHEGYYVLGCPLGWLNVFVTGGLGPVPEPASVRGWQAEMTGGVQDMATGRALPLDHHGDDR